MKVVSGIYHDADAVTEAVRALLGESVPADSIGVSLRRSSGATETVEVQDETGVLEGAWLGARIGALLGALIMGGLAVAVPLASGTALFRPSPSARRSAVRSGARARA